MILGIYVLFVVGSCVGGLGFELEGLRVFGFHGLRA